MAIPWKKIGVAAGVGAGDVGLIYLDKKMGWTKTFRRSQDYLHVGIWGYGLWKGWKGTMPDYLEAAMVADTPLVVKSLLGTVVPMVASRVSGYSAVAEAERMVMSGRRVSQLGRVGLVPGNVPLPTQQEEQRAIVI